MALQDEFDRTNAEGYDPRLTPSQAEGDRETIEQDLGEEGFGSRAAPIAGGGEPVTTPSQAEGDRETVERDIEKRERRNRGEGRD